jgi:HK97 family phage prohead protease
MEQILKFFRGEVKGVDEEKKTLTAIVSTKQEDRDGDIIEPESFREMLKHYKKHPVLLADHNYYDLRKQIGKANNIEITEKDVQVTFEYFHGMGNEEADWAWELAKRGLASFSIGFIGHDWQPLEKKTDSGEKYVSGRRFTKIELMEVSQVLIPSNRGALQASADLCEMAIKSFKPEDFPKAKREEMDNDEAQKLIDKGEAVIPPEAIVAPVTVEAQEGLKAPTVNNEVEKPHYSEGILGKEAEKPESEPDKTAIDGAVKQAINEAFKGGK